MTSELSLITGTQMGKFSCSVLRGFDLNHFVVGEDKCPKALQLNCITHGTQGENLHNPDIWAGLTRTFDTVYKVLNYLPNTPIPTCYFLQCIRHNSLSSVFIFPVCLSELWDPFGLRPTRKCSKIEYKDNSQELLFLFFSGFQSFETNAITIYSQPS